MGRVVVVRSEPGGRSRCCRVERALPWPAWSVHVGNPHLVLLAPDLEGVAIGAIGPTLEGRRPGGQNVEIATCGPVTGELSLVVWERGAGVTLACGTGSVAAAAAAVHSAGISPARRPGAQPGRDRRGDALEVTIRWRVSAELAGPVRRVARIEVDPAELVEPEKVVAAS